MAALDRRLRRGQRALSGLEQVCSTASRIAEAVQQGWRAARDGRPPRPEPKPDSGAGSGTV
jgi:hypothetical protein